MLDHHNWWLTYWFFCVLAFFSFPSFPSLEKHNKINKISLAYQARQYCKKCAFSLTILRKLQRRLGRDLVVLHIPFLIIIHSHSMGRKLWGSLNHESFQGALETGVHLSEATIHAEHPKHLITLYEINIALYIFQSMQVKQFIHPILVTWTEDCAHHIPHKKA